MTRNEPLPCPFCDNLGVTCYEGSTFRWVFAECDVCGAASGEVRKDTLSKDRDAAQAEAESDAITAWNIRALRDMVVTDAMVDAARITFYGFLSRQHVESRAMRDYMRTAIEAALGAKESSRDAE